MTVISSFTLDYIICSIVGAFGRTNTFSKRSMNDRTWFKSKIEKGLLRVYLLEHQVSVCLIQEVQYRNKKLVIPA